jgi:hypothetical protein
MRDDFHKNKIYRVKELTAINGQKVYVVQACNNLFEAFIGAWKEYSKQNSTLAEAIDQIETLHRWRLKTSRIVHQERKDE